VTGWYEVSLAYARGLLLDADSAPSSSSVSLMKCSLKKTFNESALLRCQFLGKLHSLIQSQIIEF